MHYEVGKSYAWFQPYGRGYHAVFAYPGNKRTRLLCKGDKPVVFKSYADAIAAAQMQVRKHCEPDILAIAAAPEPMAQKLAAELVQFKGRREEERHRDRQIFRKGGKAPVIVETRRRAP